MLISKLIHRRFDIYSGLAISSIINLYFNPYSILNLSFILSYSGIFGILIYQEINKSHKIKNKLVSSVIISICIQIVLIPILINNFNSLALIGIISTICIAPLLSMIITFAIIGILLSYVFNPIADAVGNIINFLVNVLLNITEKFADIPFSKVLYTRIDIPMVMAYYVLLIYIVYLVKIDRLHIIKHFIKKNYIKIISFSIIICTLTNLYNTFNIRNLEIKFIDVGQGDSTLIRTPHGKIILIDGGGESTDSKEGDDKIGKQILLPYLLNQKIKEIDYVFISHFDTDHSAGLIYIIRNIKVKNVIIGKQFETSKNYEQFIKLVKNKNIKVDVVEAGQRVNIEKDLYFDILWPSSKDIISDNAINNNSLVSKLVYKDFSMLFTGDIEEIAENAILKKYKNKLNSLNATVLKVAHHGSKTSSSEQFLKAVKLKIALIGVGENNTFGHPSNVTIENLNNIGCKIYRTDQNGEISIQVDKNGKIWIDKMLD